MTNKIKTTAVIDEPSDAGTALVPIKKQILAKIKQLKTDLADLEKLVSSMKEASTGVGNPGKAKGTGA